MALDFRHIARNLKPLRRNAEWLRSPVPLPEKLRYYPAVLRAYAGFGKRVRYLGSGFVYDNPATPLNLMHYPSEVGGLRDLLRGPCRVLDVGANLGQFARTLTYLAPDCLIDCFEPNPDVFEMLLRNATPAMRTFPYAVGRPHGPFYYEPGRSAAGSFLRTNAGDQGRLRELSVRHATDVAAVTGCDSYDLVKVDVEGFEVEAVAGLAGIRTRYLYMEVSGSGRARNFSDAQLMETIAATLGPFDIRSSSGHGPGSVCYDLLLEFVPS